MSERGDYSLTVQTTIPQKKLGRYRDQKGIYLIRQEEKVLYIGASENLYKAIMRLFQKKGALAHLDRDRLQFEIISTTLLSITVENVLKRYFEPKYNKRIQRIERPSKYEKRHFKRILDSYLGQTRFDVPGEHQSDPKT